MSMADPETGVGFHNLTFGGEDLELSYYELERNLDPKGVREVRTVIIPLELIEAEVVELQETLEQIVEKAAVAMRRAPDTFVGRR